MSLNTLDTGRPNRGRDNPSLLSPVGYDDDAASIHSRSDQDSDSDDDELQLRARNSRELLAHDRIVLMEEDETDKLVADARKKQERERRGSGLAVPNPLQLFRRPSLGSMSSAGSSRESLSLETEKRRSRKARRQTKKKRRMEQAHHGEDGELMYEMEEGGMMDDSISGDSDESDRRRLGLMAQNKQEKGRSWRRLLFINLLIAIGFAMLVLIAWKLSNAKRHTLKKQHFVSNGTALFGPTTIVISLDGFRADFLQRGLTPRLSAFVKEGISPKYMLPSFPSVTFPNHYTLATGLYPESHGIVGNTFWDTELQAEFYYTDKSKSMDPKWWGGEPFWATAEKQGVRSAVHMWPGSEANILGIEPSVIDKYNGHEKLDNKVKRVLEFLDMPGKENKSLDSKHYRPQLIAAYVPNVDADGHRFGPNSTEIRTTISEVDKMMDNIFKGLDQRNLTNLVNVVVVSDHGMATTDRTRLLQFEDLVDPNKIEHIDGWPLYGLRPKDAKDLKPLYDDLAKKAETNPNFDVYLRDVNMPKRYQFSNNKRIAPLWIVPKTGWAIVTKDEFDVEEGKKKGLVYHPRGLHGYDHEHPLMRAIFIARGPAFPHPANSEMEAFQNIELYNLLCDSVGITPMPNNGTLRLPLKPVGQHKPEDNPPEPEDPVPENKPQRPTRPATAIDSRPTVPPAKQSSSSSSAALSTSASTAVQGTTTISVQRPAESSEVPEMIGGHDPGTIKGTIEDVWSWLSHKGHGLWDKIFGSDSD